MKEKKCGIYCIENIINNKKYIGKSCNIISRWYEHKNDLKFNRHHNAYLQNSYNFYGKENFKYYILEECKYFDLNEREMFYINLYNSNNKIFGYNMSLGGDGNCGIERTKKWGDNISLGKIGCIFSDEHIKNLRLSHLGHVNSESAKIKLRMSMIGKKKANNTSSIYVGVTKINKKWKSCISINRKPINLGRFELEIDAAEAYDKACWEMFHNLKFLNFPANYIDMT